MNAAKFIWMDGKLVPWDDAKVHVLTHTLHYGLGAFEGLRCYKCEDGRSAIFRPAFAISRYGGQPSRLDTLGLRMEAWVGI